jgi:heme exporter protein CcmD
MAGKYAVFVWGAYGASCIAFTWMILDTFIRSRAARRALERLEGAARSESDT